LALAVAWLYLSLATAVNQGFYSPPALACLMFAAVLLLAPPSLWRDHHGGYHSSLLLLTLLCSVYNLLVTIAAYEGTRYHAGWTQPWIGVAQVIFIAGIASYV